jgi:hypothetical protein
MLTRSGAVASSKPMRESESRAGTPRGKKTVAPFCWCEHAALTRIREAFDGLPFLADALAIYLTLTEFASEARSDTFQRGQRHIAERSGVSKRQVEKILPLLRDAGVLRWTQNSLEGTTALAFNTYTLVRVSPAALDAPRTARHATPPEPDAVPHANSGDGNSAEKVNNGKEGGTESSNKSKKGSPSGLKYDF